MNGYKMREVDPKAPTYLRPSNVADPPTTVDWRTKGYVTEVKNQVSDAILSAATAIFRPYRGVKRLHFILQNG